MRKRRAMARRRRDQDEGTTQAPPNGPPPAAVLLVLALVTVAGAAAPARAHPILFQLERFLIIEPGRSFDAASLTTSAGISAARLRGMPCGSTLRCP